MTMCIVKCSKTTDNFAENFVSGGAHKWISAGGGGAEFEVTPPA